MGTGLGLPSEGQHPLPERRSDDLCWPEGI